MRLFLIRHGETVDNVANLYAGSRDSELTNHGVQQAKRLGEHFATSTVHFTHVFSSQLKRAVKTAELVRNAQPLTKDVDGNVVVPIVSQVKELAEQDFGSYEGVSFLARQPGCKMSGKDAHRQLHKDDSDFVDIESRDSMLRRVDTFLDSHLMPIVQALVETPACVAIVSHGITLSVLWRRLLHRMPPRSVSVHPEVLATHSGLDLERLGGWSNTGYLELDVTYDGQHEVVSKSAAPKISSNEELVLEPGKLTIPPMTGVYGSVEPSDGPVEPSRSETTTVDFAKSVAQKFVGWSIIVCSVNSRRHLTGLKRTGGGVGSSRYDDKQKSIDTFFKRRKVE